MRLRLPHLAGATSSLFEKQMPREFLLLRCEQQVVWWCIALGCPLSPLDYSASLYPFCATLKRKRFFPPEVCVWATFIRQICFFFFVSDVSFISLSFTGLFLSYNLLRITTAEAKLSATSPPMSNCNVHSEERAGFIGNHGITHLVSCLTFLKTKSTKDFYA